MNYPRLMKNLEKKNIQNQINTWHKENGDFK